MSIALHRFARATAAVAFVGMAPAPAAAARVVAGLGSGGYSPMLAIALVGAAIGLLRFILSIQQTTRALHGGLASRSTESFEDRVAARMRELEPVAPHAGAVQPVAAQPLSVADLPSAPPVVPDPLLVAAPAPTPAPRTIPLRSFGKRGL